MLTVLGGTISNSQVFLLKNVSSKNISVYAIFNDQSFNDTLTNNIVSFEQLGLGQYPDFINRLNSIRKKNCLHQCFQRKTRQL